MAFQHHAPRTGRSDLQQTRHIKFKIKIHTWNSSPDLDTDFLMISPDKTRTSIRFSIACFLLYGLIGITQLFSQSFENAIDQLLEPYDRLDAPGVAVGVVSHGDTIYAKGWGMADLEHNIPISPDSVFDIASVSKQFAGLAIAILESEGKIALDDPIHKHVKSLPDVFAPVELRHLVHHTSGIRDWPGALVLGGRRFDDVISFHDTLAMARRQEALSFPPGEMYSYSNTGYNLLARTVETVTGNNFADWIRDHIFDPLEMNHSHFHDNLGTIITNRVRSYQGSRDGPFRNIGNQLMALGSSSMYSTVHDLLKWIVHFDQPNIMDASIIKKAMTPGLLNNGKLGEYAYGLSVGAYRGTRRISHSGGWAGFRTYLLYLPEFKLGVVVLSNWSGMNPSSIANKTANIILGDKLPDKPQIMVGALPASKMEAIADSNKAWKKWVGVYTIDEKEGSKLHLYERNSKPWITLPDGTGVILKAKTLSQLFNVKKDLKLTGSSGVNGWPRSLHIESPQWTGVANESVTLEKDESRLSDYSGVYYSTELLTEYRIQVDGNTLKAIHHRHDPVTLEPYSKDRFTSNVWYWSKVDFDRNERDQVTGLRVTQGRNRNMVFLKK